MSATHDPRPIGVFDSGIGGLTAVRELFRRLPHESIAYFGDTARLPYGNKSRETVTRFALEITAFLVRRDVKCVVVACNTASSHALGELRAAGSITPTMGREKRARSSPPWAAARSRTRCTCWRRTPT